MQQEVPHCWHCSRDLQACRRWPYDCTVTRRMGSVWFKRLALFLLMGGIEAWCAPAWAEQLDAAPRGQEWVGVELTPVSLGFGTAPNGQAPERLQAGGGGTLRLLRRAWGRGYLVP